MAKDVVKQSPVPLSVIGIEVGDVKRILDKLKAGK